MQVKFDEGIRGINDKMKIVDTPGVVCTVPFTEARLVQTSKRYEIQKMRRYGAAVPPLKRISNLEKDLEKVIRQRRNPPKPIVNKSFLSPPKDRQQNIMFIREDLDDGQDVSQCCNNPLNMTDNTGTNDRLDTPLRNDGIDGSASVIFSECSDQSLTKAANADEDSIFGGSIRSGVQLSVPTDLKVKRSSDPTAFALATQARRSEPRKLSANSSARGIYSPGTDNLFQLYKLDNNEDIGVDRAFQHTRDQLLSKKDKVYNGKRPDSPNSKDSLRKSVSAGDASMAQMDQDSCMPFIHGVLSPDQVSDVLAKSISHALPETDRPVTMGSETFSQPQLDPRQSMPSRFGPHTQPHYYEVIP